MNEAASVANTMLDGTAYPRLKFQSVGLVITNVLKNAFYEENLLNLDTRSIVLLPSKFLDLTFKRGFSTFSGREVSRAEAFFAKIFSPCQTCYPLLSSGLSSYLVFYVPGVPKVHG